MISFASAPGNLFNVIGSLGGVVKLQIAYQASLQTALIDPSSGVTAELTAEPDVQAIVGSAYISMLNSVGSNGGTLQQVAEQILNRKVFRDNPRLNQTLQQNNTLASLLEVIRQMKIAGASVLAMNVTFSNSSFTGVGNGVINASAKRPLDGAVLENAYSETLLFTCSGDSYNGSATAGNEPFTVTGVGTESDVFAFDWPLGSNCSFQVSAIDGNSDNASGNLLTNSGFEEWTANVPDNWELEVGTAGTNINEETGIVYDGDAAIRITGDAGGTLTSIRQAFDDTDGTSGQLSTYTQYSICLWMRRDGNPNTQGELTIDLVDEGGVTVIQDAAGVANTQTFDLTTLTTEYAPYTAVFRTPPILPAGAYIRLRLVEAYDDGFSFYIDKLSMGEMTQAYTSGPWMAVHAGSTPFLAGDYGTSQVTNSRGSGGTLSTFQTLFSQLFTDMISSELLLPSSATPTISDTLIA